MQKTSALKLTASAGTPRAISGFTDYINEKNAGSPSAVVITNDNIVEEFIKVMNKNLLFNGNIDLAANVLPLYQIMFKIKITRPEIFSYLRQWCSVSLPSVTTNELRKLTVFDNLSPVTAACDPNPYTRDSNSITVGVTPSDTVDGDDLDFVRDISVKDRQIYVRECKKYQCGTCWICNKPIYLFYAKFNKGISKSKTKGEEGFLNGSCGEDEHLMPAGAGNMFGTLLHKSDLSIAIAADKTSLISMGLRASHTWCNRCKTDLVFMLPPVKGAGYTINYVAISKFRQTAKKWLVAGASKLKTYSYEIQFSSKQTPGLKTNLLNDMVQNINSNITKLCNMANNLVTTAINPTPDIYTAFLLRMIWYGCLLCTTLIDDSSLWGGKHQHGGSTEEIIETFFQLMTNPESPSITIQDLNNDDILLEPSRRVDPTLREAELAKIKLKSKEIKETKFRYYTRAVRRAEEEAERARAEEEARARSAQLMFASKKSQDSDNVMEETTENNVLPPLDFSEKEKEEIISEHEESWSQIMSGAPMGSSSEIIAIRYLLENDSLTRNDIELHNNISEDMYLIPNLCPDEEERGTAAAFAEDMYDRHIQPQGLSPQKPEPGIGNEILYQEWLEQQRGTEAAAESAKYSELTEDTIDMGVSRRKSRPTHADKSRPTHADKSHQYQDSPRAKERSRSRDRKSGGKIKNKGKQRKTKKNNKNNKMKPQSKRRTKSQSKSKKIRTK